MTCLRASSSADPGFDGAADCRRSGAALRIVVPIHSFEPGGVERVALNLATAWRDHGHQVTVLLGRDEGENRAIAPGLDYVLTPLPVSSAAFETPWMIACLFRYLKANPADVLFCPGNTYAIVCAAMRILLGEGCPPIAAKISNDLGRADMLPPVQAAYRLWLKCQGRLIDHFVGMADAMRAEIEAAMCVAPDKVSIIVNPVLAPGQLERLCNIDRSGSSPWRTRFLSVGRLVPQKNFALLVRAFASSARKQDTLCIAGEGPERTRLQRLAKTLGVEDRVHLPGHVHSTDKLFASADVFVLSSNYEGLPGVVVEALAAGLPIVATDCCVSMASLLDGGRQGILVPPYDEISLGEAMAAARDIPLCPSRSRWIASRFAVERAAGSYVALLAWMREMRRKEELEKIAVTRMGKSGIGGV